MKVNAYQLARNVLVSGYGYYLYRKRFGPQFWAELKRLEQVEGLSLEEQASFQAERLADIVRYAHENVPFYRRRFDEAGIDSSSIRSQADLARLPVLTRDDIVGHQAELYADNIKKADYTSHHTSGTTGTRLDFRISNDLHWALRTANMYRHYAWAGIRPGDRRLTLGGRRIPGASSYWAYNRAEDQLLLSIHHLDRGTADGYIDALVDFSPTFAQGHPSGLARLAEYMLAAGKSRPLKAVYTTGETLLPEQRATIEAAFGCRVFDAYGQGEGLFYLGECECHTGYHEFSSLGIVELIDHGADEAQAVLGTSLHNRAMPMLRYRIGDLAVPAAHSQCPCGRGLPLKIERIIGRIDDRIYLSPDSEDYMLPVTIRMHIKPCLQQGQTYQLRQRDYGRFEFTLVADAPPAESQQGAVLRTLRHLLGDRAEIDFIYAGDVISISTSGGKMRNIVSDIR